MKASIFLRGLAFLFAALSLPLYAAGQCFEYLGAPDSQWMPSATSACNTWIPSLNAAQNGAYTYVFIQLNGAPGDHSCTFEGTHSSGGKQGAGRALQARACQPKVCEAGPKGSVNITVGYHATPSINIKLNPLVKGDPFFKQLEKDRGGTMCYEGCKVGVPLPDDGAEWWVSQVAGSNGLYRSSATVDIQGTSQSCGDATPDAVTPTSTPPACDGTLGSVKLTPVCLPSTIDSGIDSSGLGEARRGNPAAGKVDPSKTPAQQAQGPGGAGNGSGTGGTSNGGGPSGGPATGSNNTPGGKGCNDGSKSPELPCSGKGELDADGNTDKPEEGKEQAACGAPGQPKCRMDEAGTPGSVGDDKYLSKLDPYKSDSEAAREQIKSVGTGIFEPWAMLFSAPPLATCEGFDLPAHAGQSMGAIDPCNVVDGIRTAMAYIWAIAAFWLCLGWVKSANQ